MMDWYNLLDDMREKQLKGFLLMTDNQAPNQDQEWKSDWTFT